MSETPEEAGRHQDLEDPRAEKAAEVKRQREADTAASRPAGGAAAPAGAPVPPPGAQP